MSQREKKKKAPILLTSGYIGGEKVLAEEGKTPNFLQLGRKRGKTLVPTPKKRKELKLESLGRKRREFNI